MIERALAVDEESESKRELGTQVSAMSFTNQSGRDRSPNGQHEENLIKHRSLSLQYTTTTTESSSRYDYL